jgi:thiamine biosynthesis protein ThiI
MKKHVLIVRYGEVALKGMNKPYFEKVLIKRIKDALSDISGISVERSDGLLIVSGTGSDSGSGPAEKTENILSSSEKMVFGSFQQASLAIDLPVPVGVLIKKISSVFGVASISPAVSISDRDIDAISAESIELMRRRIADLRHCGLDPQSNPLTFKIYSKRSDKTYPIESPVLAARIGEAVLDELGDAVKVDVNDPDIALHVHLRLREVFIYDEKITGFGGLPLGTNGKGMVLLSGGIDSPVATWLMAKRGMRVSAIHFHSYPYTSNRARDKVVELANILAGYCGGFNMHVVNLLPAQEAIAQYCDESYMTLLVRRFMMKVAETIAIETKCDMLVTGENLGQVASQTAEAMYATDEAVKTMPVMRPLIALDKTDIMDLAQKIGTFEKSIEPYEDCCTVFLPKHPATRPQRGAVLEQESRIPDLEELVAKLVKNAELIQVRPI